MRTPLSRAIAIEPKKKNLTKEQRQAVVEALLTQSGTTGKLKRGSYGKIAAELSIKQRTVRRIWKQVKVCRANGQIVDVSSKMPQRVGRKRVQIDRNKIRDLLPRERSNVRSLSNALKMPKSTVHRRIKEGFMRPHSNPLKPYLTEENKRARMLFCLSMLEPPSLEIQPLFIQPFFQSMYNYVHIDEKWFFLTKESERYYLLPEEEAPLRTCKSKRFIPKVMFLAAVARPRFDANGKEEFSGKIGIFPFTYKEPARRNSKNRLAGTLETKAIMSVTKDVFRSFLIDKVFPAIRSSWPRSSEMEAIYVQLDNAKPHAAPSDCEFLEAACKDGFDIRLTFQPPNSPDMNVLDLGYFRAIQSLQYQQAAANIDELVRAVEKSFEELPVESLNHVFLSLQACMIEVLKVNGGNNYTLPHISKGLLMRRGNLPVQLPCEQEIVDNALAYLQQ